MSERPLTTPLAEVLALVAPERLIPRQALHPCCIVGANLSAPVEEAPTTQIGGWRRGDDPTTSAPRLYAILRLARICRECGTKHRFFIDQEIRP